MTTTTTRTDIPFIPTNQLVWKAEGIAPFACDPDDIDAEDKLTTWGITLSVDMTGLEDRKQWPNPITEPIASAIWFFGADYEDFDAHSQELADYAAVLNRETWATGLFIAYKVQVMPEFRGQLLGPMLVAETIHRLAGHCPDALIVTEPAPFLLEEGTDEYRAERRRLQKMWRKTGFATTPGDRKRRFMSLDLQSTTAEDARRKLYLERAEMEERRLG